MIDKIFICIGWFLASLFFTLWVKEKRKKLGFSEVQKMKYEVEYAKFMKVEIEADSLEEAKEKANIMDDEDIDQYGENEPYGYVVWNEPKPLN